MRSSPFIFTALVAVTAALSSSFDGSPERSPRHAQKVAPKLPDAVRQAVERAYPGAQLSAHVRARATITLYEVELQSGGQSLEVLVGDDGTIAWEERAIQWAELPAPVVETLGRLAGGRTIRELERIEQRAKPRLRTLDVPEVTYEAEWTVDGREVEVNVTADGTLTGDDDADDGPDDDDRYGDDGPGDDD